MCTEPYRWHYDYPRIAWDTGFCFKSHKSLKAFDRNGIALLDIERIIHERDIAIVEHHIQNILEYNLDLDEARILDPHFVKLFRLSQLAVEYLNYCKKYLDTTIITIKTDLQNANEENSKLKHEIVNYEAEINKLRKKVKDLKSTLHVYQQFHSVDTAHNPVGSFRCIECNKIFINAEYLKAHILRRHPNSELPNFDVIPANTEVAHTNTTPVHSQYKTETDRLQMEIKELKEKLNSTERLFQNKVENARPELSTIKIKDSGTQSEDYYKHIEKLHQQFEILKTQIESEMKVLKTQKTEQEKYEKWMEEFFHKLEERNKQEIKNHKTEISQVVGDDSKKTENVIIETSISNEENVTKQEENVVTNNAISEVENENNIEISDVAKITEKVEKVLEERTRENIEKLGTEISQKMANTFNVLEERLETFWNKLQGIENIRDKQQNMFNTCETKDTIKNILEKSEEIVTIHENKDIPSQSSDEYSETESSKNQKHEIEIHKPESVIKSVQKNDKIARNLLAELKTKVQERNKSLNVEIKKPNKPKISTVKVENPIQQQIYSSSSKLDSSSTESDTETESETDSETESLVIKPSKTITNSTLRPATEGGRSTKTGISTLQNRSITSLENTLRTNSDILLHLRNDMKKIVSNRLRDLGVDPEWTRIPDQTYKKNSEIVAHHRTMAIKNNKLFFDIRNSILENLEERVNDIKHAESKNLTPEPEQKTSKLKTLFFNMKDKAKSMIKSEKNALPLPIYKLTTYRSVPNVKQAPENVKSLKSKSVDVHKKLQEVISGPTMYDTDSDIDAETLGYHQNSPVQSNIKSVVQSGKKILEKSKSESSMVITEFSDQELENRKNTSLQNVNQSLDSILEIKRELSYQQHISKEKNYSASSLETVDNINNEEQPTNDDQPHKKILVEKHELDNSTSEIDSYDLKHEEKVRKSVLKSSTTVPVKKKVIFDLHSDKSEIVEQHPIEVKDVAKKTIVKNNSFLNAKDLNDSSSIDSSIFELHKKTKGDTISTKAVINVSAKQNKTQDDVSDWDISDLN